MSLVFGAILPHGPDIIPEITSDLSMMAETRAAMEEAGRRFAAARPDTVILLDPDLVHTQNKSATRTLFTGEGTLTVGVAPQAAGILFQKRESYACDVPLAQAILSAGRKESFPVVPVEGNNGNLPLVGGALIPLRYTLHPLPAARPRLVVITPSPAIPRKELWRFGRFLAQLADQSGKRIALIASADQGHTHDINHKKFGFSPAAAQFDALYSRAVRENRLEQLMDVSDQMLKDSWADSLWMTLILAGALDSVPMPLTTFSYAVPTYFGMVVAVYEAKVTG